MSDDHQNFDLFRALVEHAGHLNAISTPAASPQVSYDIMSGSLVWSDETNSNTPIEVIWALRFIVAFRTGLMLNKPRDEFKAVWDHAISLFPKWVGFHPERRQPTPELLAIYRRGAIGFKKCLRDLEKRMDAQLKEEAEPRASDAPPNVNPRPRDDSTANP